MRPRASASPAVTARRDRGAVPGPAWTARDSTSCAAAGPASRRYRCRPCRSSREQAAGHQLVEVLARRGPGHAGRRRELAGRPGPAVDQRQAHAGPGGVGQQAGQPGDRGAVRRGPHRDDLRPRTPGQGDPGEAQGAADEGQRDRRLAQQHPGQHDRDRRHQVGGRPHPAGGRVRQGVGPGGERDRGGERAEVDDPAEGRDAGASPASCDQLRRERQAGDRPDRAGQPGDLERRQPGEQRLLGDHADGVADRGDEAEQDAGRTGVAPGGGGADHDDPGEGDQAARDQRAAGSPRRAARRRAAR